MDLPKLLQRNALVLLSVLCSVAAMAQVNVQGTVYDRSQRYPMYGVSVMGSSGIGTTTDSLGHYTIRLRLADSLYFSYLGKTSSKIPVKNIEEGVPFDMSLDVPVDSLSTVFVNPRSYRKDSLENRREYRKIFDYDGSSYVADKRAGNNATFGIGLDIDMLFNGKRNKRMDNFRQFLEQEEHDKYVDHRFTKAIVRKITGLQPPAIDTFMRMYRPSYEFVLACSTEIELYQYIQTAGKSFSEMWKQDHPTPVSPAPGEKPPANRP